VRRERGRLLGGVSDLGCVLVVARLAEYVSDRCEQQGTRSTGSNQMGGGVSEARTGEWVVNVQQWGVKRLR
jgi:hypothetical protein